MSSKIRGSSLYPFAEGADQVDPIVQAIEIDFFIEFLRQHGANGMRLTDRIKEQIVIASGFYAAPFGALIN